MGKQKKKKKTQAYRWYINNGMDSPLDNVGSLFFKRKKKLNLKKTKNKKTRNNCNKMKKPLTHEILYIVKKQQQQTYLSKKNSRKQSKNYI